MNLRKRRSHVLMDPNFNSKGGLKRRLNVQLTVRFNYVLIDLIKHITGDFEKTRTMQKIYCEGFGNCDG